MEVCKILNKDKCVKVLWIVKANPSCGCRRGDGAGGNLGYPYGDDERVKERNRNRVDLVMT